MNVSAKKSELRWRWREDVGGVVCVRRGGRRAGEQPRVAQSSRERESSGTADSRQGPGAVTLSA